MPEKDLIYTKLLESLKRGDPNALTDLYELSRERLFALAYTIIQDEEASKDLVQDFFIDFWENQLYNRITSSLKNYIARSVWNRSKNLKKENRNLQQLTADLGINPGNDFTHNIEDQELGKDIDAALDKLPKMARTVFELHYLDKYSYAEISNMLGISKKTISKHMDKALKRLRADLKKVYKN